MLKGDEGNTTDILLTTFFHFNSALSGNSLQIQVALTEKLGATDGPQFEKKHYSRRLQCDLR